MKIKIQNLYGVPTIRNSMDEDSMKDQLKEIITDNGVLSVKESSREVENVFNIFSQGIGKDLADDILERHCTGVRELTENSKRDDVLAQSIFL